MCKLAREGEMAAIDPAQDKWAEVLFERALKFRLWQDQLEDVVEKLAVSCCRCVRMQVDCLPGPAVVERLQAIMETSIELLLLEWCLKSLSSVRSENRARVSSATNWCSNH